MPSDAWLLARCWAFSTRRLPLAAGRLACTTPGGERLRVVGQADGFWHLTAVTPAVVL